MRRTQRTQTQARELYGKKEYDYTDYEYEKIFDDDFDYKDFVDDDFDAAKKVLINNFSKDGNPEYLINLMMVAKYLEKIGDHAVNVAKWTKFVTTGKAGR